MSFGDLSRINTNVQSLQALNAFNQTNQQLGQSQLRLATGSQINRAEDDSAGFAITQQLTSTIRSQAQALSNVGDAKSMLTVGEGALNTTMDILQTMKEKAIQAASDSMGENEREMIQNQLDALVAEIDDVLGTDFNGTELFDAETLTFQVGANAGDTFEVALSELDSTILGIEALDVETDNTTREAAITAIDDAIDSVSEELGGLGDFQSRLSFKEQNLSTSNTNYEAARSRIADVDFAREQMEITKMQILQQTGTAALAQANASPQAVLSLF